VLNNLPVDSSIVGDDDNQGNPSVNINSSSVSMIVNLSAAEDSRMPIETTAGFEDDLVTSEPSVVPDHLTGVKSKLVKHRFFDF
jgi:hypothetical protein